MSEIEAQEVAEQPVEAPVERRTSVDDHHDEKIKVKFKLLPKKL